MKTKTIRIWLVLGLVSVALTFVAAIGLLWKKEPPPQTITLPNGEKYQFAGVTYGTRPVPPSLAARVVSWLPSKLADRARKRFAASLSQNNPGRRFPSPQLMVWFRRLGTNPPSPSIFLSMVLADHSGVVAGRDGSAGTGTAWFYAAFPVVPKRSRELQCHFYGENIGNVTFSNPLYSQFPQWEPEPVPAVKKVEDLEVRLERLETGYSTGVKITSSDAVESGIPLSAGTRFSHQEDRATVFDISLRSSAGTNTWVLRSADLSDATGNVFLDTVLLDIPFINAQLLRTDWGSGYSKLISGTLWPDEAAWRLKLEFKRPAGLAAGNLVTFRNVPLQKAGATKPITRTAPLGPYQVVLEEAMNRNTYGGEPSPRFRVQIRNGAENLAMDVIRVTTDTGAPVWVREFAEARVGSGEYSVERCFVLFNLPANVTNVDITCAIQKTRKVEFLVKPPKPK